MEYCSGGELFDYIVSKQRLREREASRFFQDLINWIEYLGKIGVWHRDLKPENLLLDFKKSLKIVDFGLSNVYNNKHDTLKTACGSPWYAAPEMIKGRRYNGVLVDIWSSGVILYAMIWGYLPFEDPNTTNLYKKIIKAEYEIPRWLSKPSINLLSRVLEADPQKRAKVNEIKKHPWYWNIKNDKNSSKIDEDQHEEVVESMLELGFNEVHIQNCIKDNKHNHVTTTYYLLIKSKQKQFGKSGKIEKILSMIHNGKYKFNFKHEGSNSKGGLFNRGKMAPNNAYSSKSQPPHSRTHKKPINSVLEASTIIPRTAVGYAQNKAESVEPKRKWYDTIEPCIPMQNQILSKKIKIAESKTEESHEKINKSGRSTPNPSPNKFGIIIKRVIPSNIPRPYSYQVTGVEEAEKAANWEYEGSANSSKEKSKAFMTNYQRFSKIKSNMSNYSAYKNSKTKSGIRKNIRANIMDSYKTHNTSLPHRDKNPTDMLVNDDYSSLHKSRKYVKSKNNSKRSNKNLWVSIRNQNRNNTMILPKKQSSINSFIRTQVFSTLKKADNKGNQSSYVSKEMTAMGQPTAYQGMQGESKDKGFKASTLTNFFPIKRHRRQNTQDKQAYVMYKDDRQHFGLKPKINSYFKQNLDINTSSKILNVAANVSIRNKPRGSMNKFMNTTNISGFLREKKGRATINV